MAAKKRRTKKVNYAEFLAWLEGVESMQEAEWTPSPVQWKTIREKLNSVVPTVETREVEVKLNAKAATPAHHPGHAPVVESAFDAPVQMPAQAPVALRPQISAHQKPSEHEGVPASLNGPFTDTEGNLLQDEFL